MRLEPRGRVVAFFANGNPPYVVELHMDLADMIRLYDPFQWDDRVVVNRQPWTLGQQLEIGW